MCNFKVYTTFNKSLGQTAPSAWKCLKTQFWAPLTNWKFEPSSKAHTHSDPIINKHTEKVKILRMDLSWHALNSVRQAKTLSHSDNLWLSNKKNPHPPTKTRWNQAQFQKGQLTPCKTTYVCFSPLTSELESFGHKSTPSERPWIEVYIQDGHTTVE